MPSPIIDLPKVNATYSFQGQEYLVAYSSYDSIRLEDVQHSKFVRWKPEKFDSLLKKGEISLVSESVLTRELAAIHSLSSDQQQRFDRRVHYVVRFLNEREGCLSRNEFPELVSKFAKEIDDLSPPCYASVAEWIRKYKSQGSSRGALLDQHCHINRRRTRLHEDVEAIIRSTIDEVLFKPERVSEKFVYMLVKGKIHEINDLLGGSRVYDVPCFNTFRARVDDYDPMLRIERTHGRHVRKNRNTRGGKLHFEEYIGSRVEIDSNFVDVFVIDPLLNYPIRPRLTLAIDVATRCILGWDLSLESISSAKTLAVLKDAMTYDPFIETKAVPHQLYIDNGIEFVNKSLEKTCSLLGISVVRCSPKSGNQKAHVERFFKTLNTKFVHNLAGTTKSSPTDRGDYDSQAEAIYTIDFLKHALRKFITETYHIEEHSDLMMSPLAMWRMLADERPPRTVTEDEAKGMFLHPQLVSINHGRVRAFGLEWYGPGLPTLHESLSRSRQKIKVLLLVDPNSIGNAIVMDPTKSMPPQPVRCTLDPKFHGFSLVQMKVLHEQRKAAGEKYSVADNSIVAKSYLRLHRLMQANKEGPYSKKWANTMARKNLTNLPNIHSFEKSLPAPTIQFLEEKNLLESGIHEKYQEDRMGSKGIPAMGSSEKMAESEASLKLNQESFTARQVQEKLSLKNENLSPYLLDSDDELFPTVKIKRS